MGQTADEQSTTTTVAPSVVTIAHLGRDFEIESVCVGFLFFCICSCCFCTVGRAVMTRLYQVTTGHDYDPLICLKSRKDCLIFFGLKKSDAQVEAEMKVAEEKAAAKAAAPAA